MVDPASPEERKGTKMRAVRDEDEEQPARPAPKQPRLAYEVAIGIVIGGCILWMLESIAAYITARIVMSQMQIQLPF